jgi:hypothetical protein
MILNARGVRIPAISKRLYAIWNLGIISDGVIGAVSSNCWRALLGAEFTLFCSGIGGNWAMDSLGEKNK